MSKIKRFLALGLSTVLLVGILGSCASEKEKAKETSVAKDDDYVMQISNDTGLCTATLHTAVEKGFLKEEGIKYNLVKVNGTSVDLMVAGKTDAFSEMLPAMIQQIDNGLEAKIAMGIHTGCIKIVTNPKSAINSVKDLKGKKIGVPGLATPQAVIAKRALKAEGIGSSPENMEVELIVYTQAELPIALKDGKVDAAVMSDPAASISVKETGGKVIMNTATDDEYKNEYCCVLVFRPDFVKEHPEIAEKYVRAMKKAGEYVQNNQLEVAKIQIDKKIVALGDPEFNSNILKTYKFIPSVKEGKESLKRNFYDLQKLNLIKNDLDLDKVIENSYIEFEGIKE